MAPLHADAVVPYAGDIDPKLGRGGAHGCSPSSNHPISHRGRFDEQLIDGVLLQAAEIIGPGRRRKVIGLLFAAAHQLHMVTIGMIEAPAFAKIGPAHAEMVLGYAEVGEIDLDAPRPGGPGRRRRIGFRARIHIGHYRFPAAQFRRDEDLIFPVRQQAAESMGCCASRDGLEDHFAAAFNARRIAQRRVQSVPLHGDMIFCFPDDGDFEAGLGKDLGGEKAKQRAKEGSRQETWF